MIAWYNRERLTPCRANPERCENREIKHVILDADDTIWDIKPFGLAGNCPLPIEKHSETHFTAKANASHQEEGLRLHIGLKPGLLETLDELKKRGIGVSVASHNPDRHVNNMLKSMGLHDKFDRILSTYMADKDQMVAAIAKAVDVPEENILFVDDSVSNVEDVALGTDAMAVVMGIDVAGLDEVLKIIDGKGLKHE